MNDEPIRDIASHRALDNVLPHIAYRHFSKPDDTLTSQSDGRWCFRRFVNSYVNSDRTYALLPGTERSTGSPFIVLWQSAATLIEHAAADDNEIGLEILWSRFLDSLEEYSQEWTSFLRIELGADAANHCQSRVPGWRDAVLLALPEVLVACSKLSSQKDPRAVKFRDLYAQVSAPQEVDSSYREEAGRNRVHLAEYGMAVGFNIFKRGALYSRLARVRDLSTALFPLREAASVTNGVVNELGSVDELDWGSIFDAYLADELIRRDAELFLDLLREVRITVSPAARSNSECMNATSLLIRWFWWGY